MQTAGGLLQRDRKANSLVIIGWVNGDELADLAESPLALIERGEHLKGSGNLETRRLREKNRKRLPENVHCGHVAGGQMKFPALGRGRGPKMADVNPVT